VEYNLPIATPESIDVPEFVMQADFRKVRIFVASPSDVQSEREQLAKVINELNLTITAIAPEKRVLLELVRWETHVAPSLGSDPQDVVNRQIGEYDLFVGILWKRMGTPTAVARSGTEEEFNRAYELWQQNRAFPVLLYFCQQAFPPPRLRDEVDQLGKVMDFRTKVSAMGLVADYADHDQFADVIRPHLLLVIGRMLAPNQSPTELASQLAQQRETVEALGLRQQIAALAQEYEHIRATTDAGDTRTRKMEGIASRMRSLALAAHTLVPELTASASPGQRLAAATMLQAVPKPEFLTWLAQRLGIEKPFVAYHAALALLSSVRALRLTHADKLRAALALAKEQFSNSYSGVGGDTPDRYRLLEEAENELDRPSAGTAAIPR
jgi:hypothetical protein